MALQRTQARFHWNTCSKAKYSCFCGRFVPGESGGQTAVAPIWDPPRISWRSPPILKGCDCPHQWLDKQSWVGGRGESVAQQKCARKHSYRLYRFFQKNTVQIPRAVQRRNQGVFGSLKGCCIYFNDLS